MQRDLVIRATDGDHDAFSTLAADSFGRLFRTARLILRDDGLAADAVQEALLSAWIHIRAVREPDRFDAWLRRLLIHACYREARRATRRRVMEVDVTSLEPSGADDVQQGTVLRDQLDRGFRRLSTDQRAVLVVHHYLDLADQDAADALDIPIGTFKSRLHRATTVWRAAIEADDRPPVGAQESIA